jgi:hypothetical protein
MYKKLLPLVNQFVCVRQGDYGRSYVGRLLSADTDFIEIQIYYEDGTEAEIWTIRMDTVTEFSSQSKVVNTLALKVKWATSNSEDQVEESIAAGKEVQ